MTEDELAQVGVLASVEVEDEPGVRLYKDAPLMAVFYDKTVDRWMLGNPVTGIALVLPPPPPGMPDFNDLLAKCYGQMALEHGQDTVNTRLWGLCQSPEHWAEVEAEMQQEDAAMLERLASQLGPA
jgi:hypothetical protein